MWKTLVQSRFARALPKNLGCISRRITGVEKRGRRPRGRRPTQRRFGAPGRRAPRIPPPRHPERSDPFPPSFCVSSGDGEADPSALPQNDMLQRRCRGAPGARLGSRAPRKGNTNLSGRAADRRPYTHPAAWYQWRAGSSRPTTAWRRFPSYLPQTFSRRRWEMTWATFTPEAPAWASSSQSPHRSKCPVGHFSLRSLAPPLRSRPAYAGLCSGFRRCAADSGRPGPPQTFSRRRWEMTWATFTPEAPAWARPRVMPAPSPMANMPGSLVSSSGERVRREE